MISIMYDSMKKEDILVSVIIPAYNAEKYLAFCLDSIIAQTHNKLEIIVVNDGSTDSTPKICDEYEKKDSRIKVIHQENHGVAFTRNVGLDNITGEYIAFIDSDDYVKNDYIEVLLKTCTENCSNITICKSIDTHKRELFELPFSYNTRTYDSMFLLQNISYLDVCFEVVISMIFHKSVFDNLRFPVGLIYEDSYIYYDLIRKAGKITFIDTILYYYYLSSNSIMRSDFSVKRYDMLTSYEKKLEVLKRNNCKQSYQIVSRDYLYTVAGMIGQTKYCDNFTSEFKKQKINELRKKYRELKKINKDNPYFKGRFKLISDLLYLFPIIKKFQHSSEG